MDYGPFKDSSSSPGPVSKETSADLFYVRLIQKLNVLLANQGHKNHKLSHIFEVLESFNESILHLDVQFDFVLENQRGLKFFGIPLFSGKTLLPLLDPSNFQSLREKPIVLSENAINNYPLPDLDWSWAWDTWYIMMYNDVDDQGWVYSSIVFNKSLSDSTWKGKYYTGNFVRRRIWTRMRVKGHDIAEGVQKKRYSFG